ncbi:MAG TPA: ABC transporter ATP-binding protein [Turneriella sp.]|nr:ABC transporter ATP-binding protein [Turneriella sp.]
MVIEINEVSRLFGTKRAVDKVSLTINPGERIGILGPNGSGKTTLIQLVLGFLKPNEGSIRIDGLDAWQHRFMNRRRIGALIEIPLLYPSLSARENLLFFARFSAAPLTRIDELLKLVDLDPKETKPFSTFSLGMKQRLGIALALLNDPEFLIFDEPTNGLDPEGIVQVRTILKDITKMGKSLILCSHLLPEVEQICDNVAILQDGKVLAKRNVKELSREGNSFRITAENIESAEKILNTVGIQSMEKSADNAIRVVLDAAAQPSAFLKSIIESGLKVEEFVRLNAGLENFFMNLIESQKGKEK